MKIDTKKPLFINCTSQHYDWGKIGKSSLVAHLDELNNKRPIEDKPYAEFWMGTHVNAPSKYFGTNLSDIIKEDSTILGPTANKLFNGDLPFLFKVLSIEKSLSIQAHPDKQLAEKLHSKFPDVYKDGNHKPEMAIALSTFEALSGFKMPSLVKNNLKNYPEFKNLIPEEVAEEFLKASGPFVTEALRKLFTCLMKALKSEVSTNLSSLVSRLEFLESRTPLEELILRLNKQFPGDVGCFCVMMLNFVKLEPYQAFFMGPNEPHAYLSGECLECMATSDNVVRAGLTPKFKDVDVLCSMLTYSCSSPSEQLLKPVNMGKFTSLYAPPVVEFSVALTRMDCDNAEDFSVINGPSILLCVSGNGVLQKDNEEYAIQKGDVLFLCDQSLITIISKSDNFVASLAMISQLSGK